MKKTILFLATLTILFSCNYSINIDQSTNERIMLTPDYSGCTIPQNIAPLNFSLPGEVKACAIFSNGKLQFTVKAKKGQFVIPDKPWKKLLKTSAGHRFNVTIAVNQGGKWIGYLPFSMTVAKERIDPYIAYRLIEPGYELWSMMGIYQRNIENYTQSPIMENKLTDVNCMNCHSFCMQNPDKMLLHMRAKNAGTFIIEKGAIEKLNTKTDNTMSALVYPSWHPSGNFVAFSVNATKQGFHANNPNRVEVYDEKSDVAVYDTKKHTIITSPLIFSENAYETFPTFSPDGRTLYFCTAKARPIPQEYSLIKYNICSISFDAATQKFGDKVDTIFNAEAIDKSASFPRVSPNGRFLCFTLHGYGNFSIWHKDADLWMIDLKDKRAFPLDNVNSKDVESYHSWSSNSHWLVFSSRRIDGLYTRPFFTHINDDGSADKPFLLPQKDNKFYQRFMKSYNIPEFIKGKVHVNEHALAIKAKKDKGINVTFNAQ